MIKLDTWHQSKSWYKEFFKQKPTSQLDKIYYKFLSAGLDEFIFRQIYKDIECSVKLRNSRIFFWFKNRKTYGLSLGDLFVIAWQKIIYLKILSLIHWVRRKIK